MWQLGYVVITKTQCLKLHTVTLACRQKFSCMDLHMKASREMCCSQNASVDSPQASLERENENLLFLKFIDCCHPRLGGFAFC